MCRLREIDIQIDWPRSCSVSLELKQQLSHPSQRFFRELGPNTFRHFRQALNALLFGKDDPARELQMIPCLISRYEGQVWEYLVMMECPVDISYERFMVSVRGGWRQNQWGSQNVGFDWCVPSESHLDYTAATNATVSYLTYTFPIDAEATLEEGSVLLREPNRVRCVEAKCCNPEDCEPWYDTVDWVYEKEDSLASAKQE